MNQIMRFNKILKSIIIAGDLIILNALFITLYYWFDNSVLGSYFVNSLPQLLILLNMVYLLCNYSNGVILHQRIVRPDRIVLRACRNVFLHSVVFITVLGLGDFGSLSARFFITFYTTFLVLLSAYRLIFREILKQYRRHGGNLRTAILIGEGSNMAELHHEMTGDSTSGFRVLGYFADQPSKEYPSSLEYLGNAKDVIPYMKQHSVEQVYCGLTSDRSAEILPIINYCENNFKSFYSVPNIRNYLRRRMHFEVLGNVPILSIRRVPLFQPENRLVKRTFDIVCSLIFLCIFFPFIYIFVGIAIKLSSPGPIFFKQLRSGEDGKEFWCYKFRSMRVNDKSDTQQATKDDPRKTRVGNFLRKSNLDELPQFINVLKGEMSVVGPRPHMLKHTEEYSKLIDKFMVRHLVKPGVTGWAQVTGFRGETKELWQMEGRVERDIWYIEHWTIMLDFFIIYKTVKNMIHGEPEAY